MNNPNRINVFLSVIARFYLYSSEKHQINRKLFLSPEDWLRKWTESAFLCLKHDT